MNFLRNRITGPLKTSLVAGVSYLQHMLMKAAVAISLKLCLFTARVLLNTSPAQNRQASQSF